MKPVLIGLTGSIGMGKSTTAEMFAALGVPVWDADSAVHRLYGRGGAGVSAVAVLFPGAVINGQVDRNILKKKVLNNQDALKQLEAIIHPLVAKDRRTFIDTTVAPMVVLDIPLLFELGTDEDLDWVVVVSTAPETQKQRVMARGTMTESQFQTILAKQMPDAEKRARADFVISTDTLDEARDGVKEVMQQIQGDPKYA